MKTLVQGNFGGDNAGAFSVTEDVDGSITASVTYSETAVAASFSVKVKAVEGLEALATKLNLPILNSIAGIVKVIAPALAV